MNIWTDAYIKESKAVWPWIHFIEYLEVEISVSVVVRDILHHLVYELHFALRKFAFLEVFADDAAKNAAEIFVARIRQETA